MTTIAWDGKTLAADKRTVSCGIARTCTKLWQAGHYVYAGTGSMDEVLLVKAWLWAGADPEKAPKFDEGGIRGIALHLPTGRCLVVEGKTTVTWPVEDPFHAEGSGREYALAAMKLGKTAREAVLFAAEFDLATGNGVDAYDWPPATAFELPRSPP